MVEKGGEWGWGWVGLEIVGPPIKSKKKNGKKGSLSVNNVFAQPFAILKLLVFFFREMLNILMTKVCVRMAMRAMTDSNPFPG